MKQASGSTVSPDDKSGLSFPSGTTDITAQFFSACESSLAPGELCHSPWFTLQHSMSAIEIMDPKMDIRMVGSRRILSTAEMLATGSLPLGPFTDSVQLVGIMDELLASFVNWLTGDSLAQTVFICMYMHCTQLLRDKFLATFCELLRRCVYQLRQVIVAGAVFEEEDHYALTHGMPIKEPNFSLGNSDLQEVGVYLSKYSSEELVNHAQNLISDDSERAWGQHYNHLSVICSRIAFLTHFLQLTSKLLSYTKNIDDLSLKDVDTEDFCCISNHPGPVLETNKSTEGFYDKDDVNEFWERAISMSSVCSFHLLSLNQISRRLIETASFGARAGPGKHNCRESSYGLVGFEPLLNQTNLPSYIPRLVVIHDRSAAFAYFFDLTDHLYRLMNSFHEFCTRHSNSFNAAPLHLLWSFMRACGQLPCSYVASLYGFPHDGSTSNLNSCVVARSISSFLYFIAMDRSHHHEPTCGYTWTHVDTCGLHSQFVINNWLLLEPNDRRVALQSIISELPGLDEFFNVIGEQLSLIPRLYCLNRSRQRTALAQCLQKFPAVLENCFHVEWSIGVELAKRLNPLTNEGSADESPNRIRLRLTNFLCYYYYQLAWDFLVSGFQLELYSPYEWVFMYAFIIQLLHNMHDLLGRFIALSVMNDTFGRKRPPDAGIRNGFPSDDKCPRNSLGAAGGTVTSQSSGSRRKKKKKHSKQQLAAPLESNQSTEHTSNATPMHDSIFSICGPISETELVVITIHRFLTAATMCALRALQLDSGGDPVLDATNPKIRVGYSDPVITYGKRLGLFLLPGTSPLVNPAGIQGAFDACKQYATTDIFQAGSTSELYELAWRNFENARIRTQLALSCQQADVQSSMPRFGEETNTFPVDFLQRLFVVGDRLSDLDRLANHNAIACRVLATCPDRRPKPDQPNSSSRTTFNFHALGPVKLEFDFLMSKNYPLIRLVSPQVTK